MDAYYAGELVRSTEDDIETDYAEIVPE